MQQSDTKEVGPTECTCMTLADTYACDKVCNLNGDIPQHDRIGLSITEPTQTAI